MLVRSVPCLAVIGLALQIQPPLQLQAPVPRVPEASDPVAHGHTAIQVPVQVQVHYEVPGGYLVRALGDVDGDGIADFVATRFFGGFPTGDVVSGATGLPLLTDIGNPAGGAYQGMSAAGVGDIDGDGVPDVALGSPLDSGGGAQVLSGSDGSTLFLGTTEAPGSAYGGALAGLGDWNGDGRDEFAVSATSEGVGGLLRIYDGASGALLVAHAGDAPGGGFGAALLRVADRTGDGIDELLAGVPLASTSQGFKAGAARLIDPVSGVTLLLLEGDVAQGRFGIALAALPDVDGDGLDDFVVGATQTSGPGTAAAGYVEARSGRHGAALWSRHGAPGDVYGAALAIVEDLDGDGSPDVAVGAPQNYFQGVGHGYVELLSGRDGALLHRLPAPGGPAFGASLAPLGDIDGDGVPDLAVGALLDGILSRGYVVSARPPHFHW
jgi:hypothetical protein